MNYELSVLPEAEADLAEAYHWHEERVPELGVLFRDRVDECLMRIQRNPFAYQVVHGQVRRALLRKYPYGIFYFVEEETIVIIGCFHGRRDPQVWKTRAENL